MNPLRRIVRSWTEWQAITPGGSEILVRMEELECGHKQRQKSDIYGPTNAYSRRCQRCGKPSAPATEKGWEK